MDREGGCACGKVRYRLTADPFFVHWQTVVVTDNLDVAAKRLGDSHAAFVSSGIIQTPKDSTGFSKGLLVSDPDGHDVLLIQK